MSELEEILRRLENEERDHAEIKIATKEAMALAAKVKAEADEVAEEFRQQLHDFDGQLADLRRELKPVIDAAPIMRDFAATGRVGYMLGKWAIGIAGFLSAVALIIYGFMHGFKQ